MATEIGELAAKIKLDTSGLAQAATEARQSVSSVGAAMTDAGQDSAILREALSRLVASSRATAEGVAQMSSQLANMGRTTTTTGKAVEVSLGQAIAQFQRLEGEVRQAERFLQAFGDNADAALKKVGASADAASLRKFVSEGNEKLNSLSGMTGRTALGAQSLSLGGIAGGAGGIASEAGAATNRIRELAEAFGRVRESTEALGLSAGNAFAKVVSGAGMLAASIGTGGVAGVIAGVTTAIGLAGTAWQSFSTTAQSAADRATEAANRHKAAVEKVIAKLKEQEALVRGEGAQERSVSIQQLEKDVAGYTSEIAKLRKQIQSGVGPGAMRLSNEERQEMIEKVKDLEKQRKEVFAQISADAKARAIALKREETEGILDEQNANEEARQKRIAASREEAAKFDAAQRAYYAVLDKRAARHAQDAAAERAAYDKTIAEFERKWAAEQAAAKELADRQAQAFEAEKALRERQIAVLAGLQDATLQWAGAFRSLLSGGGLSGLGGLLGGTTTAGLTGMAEVGNGSFTGSMMKAAAEVERFTGQLSEAGMKAMGVFADVASAIAELPAGAIGMISSAVSAIADAFEGFLSAIQDQINVVKAGMEDVFQGTVGLAATKALGGGGLQSAAQNSMSVAGGFAGMAAGAAGLTFLGGPTVWVSALVAAVSTLTNPLAMLTTAVLAAGAAYVVVGAGLLQLSTQSKDYQQFQQALGAVTQKMADAMGPMWRNLLPLVSVLSHVVDGMGAFFNAFVPNIAIAKGLFEASRLAGLGLLNLQIAILNVEYGFWSFIGMLVKFSRALEDWLPGHQGTMDDPGIYAEWQRVDQERAAAMNARGALEGLTWGAAMAEGALLGAASAASAAGEELTNVPSGYKVALERYRDQDTEGDPRRIPASGGTNTVNINVSGVSDPQVVTRNLLRELEKWGFERGTGASLMYAPALLNR